VDAESHALSPGVHSRLVHRQRPSSGEYLIVAIDDALAEGWQDSRVLAQLRTLATRIVLREAETRTLELRLSALRR
jgi:hypothetical protein